MKYTNQISSVKQWLGLLLLCSVGIAAADEREINESFDIGAGGELVVRTDNGSIAVKTHDKNQVDVEVTIEGFDEDEFTVNFDLSGDKLTIDGDRRSSNGWGRRKVNFEVLVPKSFNLDLKTSGGSIAVADLVGSVDARTSGGSLKFGNIEGPIDASTSGGSIKLDGAKGDTQLRTSGGSLKLNNIEGRLRARTSGGGIKLGRVTGDADVATSGGSIRIDDAGGSVRATTSGGSVEIHFTQQPSGDSRLSTSGGSITAYLADFIALDVDARARKIKSDFEIDGQTSAKHKLRGELNGGGPKLKMQTSAGNIYIRKD